MLCGIEVDGKVVTCPSHIIISDYNNNGKKYDQSREVGVTVANAEVGRLFYFGVDRMLDQQPSVIVEIVDDDIYFISARMSCNKDKYIDLYGSNNSSNNGSNNSSNNGSNNNSNNGSNNNSNNGSNNNSNNSLSNYKLPVGVNSVIEIGYTKEVQPSDHIFILECKCGGMAAYHNTHCTCKVPTDDGNLLDYDDKMYVDNFVPYDKDHEYQVYKLTQKTYCCPFYITSNKLGSLVNM
jgi:hypothetical protein